MPEYFAILGMTWFTIGLVLSVVMARRGHDAFAWLVIGMFLGPIAIGLAVYTGLRPDGQPPVVVAEPGNSGGSVDVLVGADGSPQARAAADAAVELLGSRLGRLTLARALTFYSGTDAQIDAERALREEASRLKGLEPGLELVEGEPAPALLELAAGAGYDLLVIGTRGTGLSTELMGSTALALARHSKLPVLLVGDATEVEEEP